MKASHHNFYYHDIFNINLSYMNNVSSVNWNKFTITPLFPTLTPWNNCFLIVCPTNLPVPLQLLEIKMESLESIVAILLLALFSG